MYRLIYKELTENLRVGAKPRFAVSLDGISISPKSGWTFPLFDAARWMIDQGYPSERLVTSRAHGSDVDSWIPVSLAYAASLSVTEGDREVSIIKHRAFNDAEAIYNPGPPR